MPRPKKDGSYINCKIRTSLACELEDYCNETGASKTAAIERSLSLFLTEYKKNKSLLEQMKS